MNAKLAAIGDEAAENLKTLMRDAEAKLLEAWHACEQEAQDNDGKPKFKLSLNVTLDLDADKMQTELSFGVRYKHSRDQQMPDPDQIKLPLDDTTVTLATPGMEPVTVSGKQFSALARSRAAKR